MKLQNANRKKYSSCKGKTKMNTCRSPVLNKELNLFIKP